MYREQVFWFSVVVIGLCESLDFNISGCVKDCNDQLSKDYGYVCDMRCFQDSLGELVKKDYEKALPRPAAPRLVETGWQTILLRFNTSELEGYSNLHYILEVKPHWGPQVRNLFVVFPYTRKYHYTNQTTYAVKDLEPNTGYQFRVIVIKLNKSSPYSNWSNVITTRKICKKLSCGVTNIRLELTSRRPYQKKEELKSKFNWKPAVLSERDKTQLKYITEKLFSVMRNSNCYPGKHSTKDSHSAITSNSSDENQQVYYDCWYKVKIAAVDDYVLTTAIAAERIRIFHVPKCIRINDVEICGCPPLDEGTKHIQGSIDARFTRDTSNSQVTMFLNWNDDTWKKAINITYFKVQIRLEGGSIILKDYVKVSSNDYQYNKTIFNLTYGVKYYLSIFGYHGDHCLYEDVEALDFTAIPACENSNCSKRKPNSICQPDSYHGNHKCNCDTDFFSDGNKCIDKNPCRRNPCGRNQKCTPIVPITGGHNCTCENNYLEKNGTCVHDTCRTNPCGGNGKCTPIAATGGYNCTCEKNFVEKNGTCAPVPPDPCLTNPCGGNRKCTPIAATGGRNCTCEKNFIEKNGTCAPVPPGSKNNKGVIVAAVLTPFLVTLTAVCIIIWLHKRQKKRMDLMEKEMENAADFRSTRPYVHSVDNDILADENSERVMNLLYVSQDNVHEIPVHLLESINLLELPGDSVRLRGIIGKGAFGIVYVGEAQLVNRNPEWTTVAIKTLSESAGEEKLSDFLREIELMKDIGKHKNVIQMYGCCTRYRPICLVLEYARGGNLLNYLRSLKKKCKDIAVARTSEVTKSDKEKYQKFFEAGEMPDDAPSSFPANASDQLEVEENRIKQVEDLNFKIASRINEEVRAALDTKELELFARQIASGMKHVSDLDIVHRDLAARNILLGEDKVLKIADFGLSREGTYIKKSSGKIPYRWLSIEAIQDRTYSTASDVWAFGVVLWEICTLGDTPYSSISDRDLKEFLLSGNRLEKVESCTEDIYEIMLKCWSYLPKDRPTFHELKNGLWDLEHTGNSYVNLPGLMLQSIESEDGEKHEKQKQENNDSVDGRNKQLSLNASISADKDFNNQGFCYSEEEMNAHVDQQQLVSTNA